MQDTKIVASFKKNALVLSLIIIIIGTLTEIGWQFNIDLFRNFYPGTIFMNPLTALCFILIGLSIQIIGQMKMNKFIVFAVFIGLFTALVGLLRLGTILFGLDTQIDQLLFRSKLLGNNIAPNTALCFVFMGTALIFLTRDKYYKLIQILCFLTVTVSLLAILGYMYSVKNLYGILALTPMALNTAIAFFTSSLAILFIKPDKGFMLMFSSDSAGGRMARMLVPTIFIIPPLLDLVSSWIQSLGFINAKVGFTLSNIALTAIFLAIMYIIAKKLNRVDLDRKKAEVLRGDTNKAMLNVMEDLEETKNKLELETAKDEAMLDSIGEGLIAVDNLGCIMIMNKVAENMLGFKLENVVGNKITNFRLEDEAGILVPFDKRPTTIALSTNKTSKVSYYYVRRDKTRFPIAITATPIKLNGKTIGLVEIIRDITQETTIDRAKSEFVSLASHQLRTPLGIMKWYLEAFKNDAFFNKFPDNIKEYYEQVYKSNERVISLVRDLLSVSRIDQGGVKNNPVSVDIVKIIKEITGQMQIISAKKEIALNLKITSKAIPNIDIDVLRFHEVIENLLDNAIEYSKPKDQIHLSVGVVDNNIVIIVQDTGIGMSHTDQKKLFTKFFRGEKAMRINTEGSGLGLYVVKSYVEGWGGSISLESKEDVGSTFTISLPITQKKDNERPPAHRGSGPEGGDS